MHTNLQHEAFSDEAPTRPINDGPALIRIKRLCHIARIRLEQAPDVAVADGVLADIEAMAGAALKGGAA